MMTDVRGQAAKQEDHERKAKRAYELYLQGVEIVNIAGRLGVTHSSANKLIQIGREMNKETE